MVRDRVKVICTPKVRYNQINSLISAPPIPRPTLVRKTVITRPYTDQIALQITTGRFHGFAVSVHFSTGPIFSICIICR